MRVLVTGAKGFVGKNLCAALRNIRDGKDRRFPELKIEEIFEYDLDSTAEELDQWCSDCDFVFNLAGVNRPKEQSEFMAGNFGFASTLLDTLKKKAGEELFFDYERDFLHSAVQEFKGLSGLRPRVLVYRFPNLFGKWCRPNYNSAVATFCNAFANDLPYTVNDPSVELELLYIDDLVDEMICALLGKEHHCEFDGVETVMKEDGRYCAAPITHKVTLGEIVELLKSFVEQPRTLMIPEIPAGSFAKKLYSTYLSYLPTSKVAFPLKMNVDDRGSFTELVHTLNAGQVSINISRPGITKGQHWHNTKFEQFIVVKGHGLIQQRNLNDPEGKVLEWEVSGDKIQAVHMLPGYTHNIINLSETEDLVTVMYCNEIFDPGRPDTFFEKV